VDNDSNKMQQSRPQLRVITDFSAHQPTSKAKPRLIKANHPVTSAPIDPYSPSSGGKPEYSCTRTPKLHLHHPIPHHHHFYAATHHGNFDADADLAMIVQTAPPPLMSRDFPVLNSLPPRPPASLSFFSSPISICGELPSARTQSASFASDQVPPGPGSEPESYRAKTSKREGQILHPFG